MIITESWLARLECKLVLCDCGSKVGHTGQESETNKSLKVGLLFQTAEAFPGVSEKGSMTKVVFFKCYLTCAEVGVKWKKKILKDVSAKRI